MSSSKKIDLYVTKAPKKCSKKYVGRKDLAVRLEVPPSLHKKV
jgi:hypothetical protein